MSIYNLVLHIDNITVFVYNISIKSKNGERHERNKS